MTEEKDKYRIGPFDESTKTYPIYYSGVVHREPNLSDANKWIQDQLAEER
jgi:hypothetical protein